MKQPPLSLIVEIQQKFAARGIHGVVDGSAVLASLGLVEEVHDWDLLTDAAPAVVQEVLEALECRYERRGPAGVFRSAGLFRVSLRTTPSTSFPDLRSKPPRAWCTYRPARGISGKGWCGPVRRSGSWRTG